MVAIVGKITQIITSVDSQRCPDLLKSDIIKCQADITTLDAENGCCEPDCKEFIGSVRIALKISLSNSSTVFLRD